MNKKIFIRTLLISLLILLLTLIISCGKKSPTQSANTKPEWTIIGYMDGNNNIDISQNGTSYTIDDVQGLEEVGSTKNVKIIVALGSLKLGGIVRYYEVQKHANELPDSISSKVVKNCGTKDMSDYQTLRDFLKLSFKNYPAKHYMLILDDHGGGWRGCCSDEQNGSGDMMSIKALRQALTDFPKIDIIVFHACLMSQVEVGYELKDAANYMVASEFSLPMLSVLGSKVWLKHLADNPKMEPLALAEDITTTVYDQGKLQQKPIHMATTDLSHIQELASHIADFANRLVTETGQYWNEVGDAWGNTHYTKLDDPSFVDIREFAKKVLQEPHISTIPLIKMAADSVISCINRTVPLTITNAAGLARGGLTIYFPSKQSNYEEAKYSELRFHSTNWQNFIARFIKETARANQNVTISGQVTWQGHTLSQYAVAIIDTSHTENVIPIAQAPIDTQSGQFTVNFQITQPIEAYFEAWDDVNNNGQLDAGDGIGWYDANKNGDWDNGDMIPIQPGQTINNIHITLSTQTVMLGKLKKK